MVEQGNKTEGIKLSWDVVVKQFENLIKFAARQQVQNHYTDPMLTAEDLYQIGMIKLYDCWNIWCVDPQYNKGMEEFSPIFKTSLFRAMGGATKKQLNIVDLEDTVMDNIVSDDATIDDTVEHMYLSHGVKHLYEMLDSLIAKQIIDELLEPSPQTIFEAWADFKRKEMLKSQGKRVNVPKDVSVKMKHIVKTLGITGKQYDIAMLEIKQKAKVALAPV